MPETYVLFIKAKDRENVKKKSFPGFNGIIDSRLIVILPCAEEVLIEDVKRPELSMMRWPGRPQLWC